MQKRKSEKSKSVAVPENPFARTTRFIETEEGWYFRTREGLSLGPYAEQFDAEISASLLITRLSQMDGNTDAKAVIQRFMTDPSNAVLVQAPKVERTEVDLKTLKRNHRLKQSIPTLARAWQTLSGKRAI